MIEMPTEFNPQIYEIKELAKSESLQIKNLETECELSSWSLDDYLNETERNDSIFLVARTDFSERNCICAFLIARLQLPSVDEFAGAEESAVQPGHQLESDILNIGVRRDFRGKGIGGRLLEYLLWRLSQKNIKAVWLEVRLSNKNAVKFYSNRGFKVIQVRKNFYLNPVEDALVMKLDMQSGFDQI